MSTQKRRSFSISSAVIAGVVFAGLSSLPAHAEPRKLVAIRDVVATATPDSVGRSVKRSSESLGRGVAISFSKGNISTQVPSDPEHGISVKTEAGPMKVRLPRSNAAADAQPLGAGMVSYDNRDGSSTVPVVVDDGSIQINTLIESPASPREYTYAFELPPGAVVKELDGGAIFFYSDEGSFIGGLAPAWAKDASGSFVPTRYRIDGQRITQVVEHTVNHRYPVVADPWLGFSLFSYVRNDVRPWWNGQPVYTMELSAWGQLIYRGSAALGLATLPLGTALPVTWLGYKVMTYEGWAEVVARQPGARTTSVRQQYVCHVRYGYPVLGSGWRWDLEKARPIKNDWTRTNVLAHRCNW